MIVAGAAGADGEGLAPVDGAAGAGLVPLRWAGCRWGQLDSARAGLLHRYVPLHHGGAVDDDAVVGDGLRAAAVVGFGVGR